MSRYVLMDPDENLNWSNDWSTNFLVSGETISSRVWTLDPDASPTLLSSATVAAVRVSGLTAGVVYQLKEKVSTTNSNDGERSITIRCEER